MTESKDDAGWQLIERGVWVKYLPGAVYGKGDYWLIPARVGTGDIEWPREGKTSLALEPNGIIHHRAALAILKKSKEEWKLVNQCGCADASATHCANECYTQLIVQLVVMSGALVGKTALIEKLACVHTKLSDHLPFCFERIEAAPKLKMRLAAPIQTSWSFPRVPRPCN